MNNTHHYFEIDKLIRSGPSLTVKNLGPYINKFYKKNQLKTPKIVIMPSWKKLVQAYQKKRSYGLSRYNPIEEGLKLGLCYERDFLNHCLNNWDSLTKDVKDYCEFLQKGIWAFIPMNDLCLICACPKIRINDQHQFHSLKHPAIQWNDKRGKYFIHGVRFDKKTWDLVKDRNLQPTEILKLANIERRYTAIQLYGVKKLMDALPNKLIDKDSIKNNELYEITLGHNTSMNWNDDFSHQTTEEIPIKAHVIKYSCPSTDRVYFSFVPNEIFLADSAMAWKFHISTKQYREELKIEA